MIEDCTAGLGFSAEELIGIRTALQAGLYAVVTVGLAFSVRLLKRWFEYER